MKGPRFLNTKTAIRFRLQAIDPPALRRIARDVERLGQLDHRLNMTRLHRPMGCKPFHSRSNQWTLPCPAKPNRTVPRRTKPRRTKPYPTAPDRTPPHLARC